MRGPSSRAFPASTSVSPVRTCPSRSCTDSIAWMWPKVRAALIAFAIVLGLIDGCPLPEPEHTPEWERGFVEPLREAQSPVTRLDRVFRVSQQWSVYQAPRATRYRMWIEVLGADGVWQLTYR